MRRIVCLTSLLMSLSLFAQETVSVKGRIVNTQGEAVEYVHVGMPKRQIGTVSSLDGRFELQVPADTLEFHHVSYQTARFVVTGPEEDLVVVLQDAELPPAVFIGGDSKEMVLMRPGTRIGFGLGDFYRPEGVVKGMELGSVAKARKPFLVKDIQFSVVENHIPGCVAAINIYRIEGDPETFFNILHKPLYVQIPVTGSAQSFDVQPDETILLEPGRYFIAFELVDCDEEAVRAYQATPEAERDVQAMHLWTPIYFKSSYQRSVALGELKYMPVNIGISVKGLEFR